MKNYFRSIPLLLAAFPAVWGGSPLAAQEVPAYVVVIDPAVAVPRPNDNGLWERAAVINYPFGSAVPSPQDAGYRQLTTELIRLRDLGYDICRLLLIRGSSSPDGNYAFNARLAHLRAQVLADSLARYIPIAPSQVEERCVAADYEALRRLMLISDVSYRDAVIAAIDKGKENATTKHRLQQIKGGSVWRSLVKDYFPALRTVRVVLYVSPRKAAEPASITPVEEPETMQTEAAQTETLQTEPTQSAEVAELAATASVLEKDAKKHREPGQPMFNVKTNLLYDLALFIPQYGWAPTPNISLEFLPKGGHISAVGEFMGSGWRNDDKRKTYIIRSILLEGRYYLKGGASFTGHYLSAYANTDKYDIQFSDTKAWLSKKFSKTFGAGIGWGYVRRIKDTRWKWEVNAAVGYLHTSYDRYHPAEEWATPGNFYYNWHDGPLDYHCYNSKFNYFGITRLGFSISYDLPFAEWKNNKKGGDR